MKYLAGASILSCFAGVVSNSVLGNRGAAIWAACALMFAVTSEINRRRAGGK